MDKDVLTKNVDKIHTTLLGIKRIKKNLGIEIDPVEFIKDRLTVCKISRVGKNYYCENNDMIATINAYSYTIITAHRK